MESLVDGSAIVKIRSRGGSLTSRQMGYSFHWKGDTMILTTYAFPYRKFGGSNVSLPLMIAVPPEVAIDKISVKLRGNRGQIIDMERY
jgi:hypothetical protein